jgi:hypothetical protein
MSLKQKMLEHKPIDTSSAFPEHALAGRGQPGKAVAREPETPPEPAAQESPFCSDCGAKV